MTGRRLDDDGDTRPARTRLGSGAIIAMLAMLMLLTPSPPAAGQDSGLFAKPDESTQVAPIYYYLRERHSETGSPEALLQAYMERHTARDYVGAVEMAHRLIEAVPDRSVGYYNLACSQARLHRYPQALEALELAIDHGWRNLDHARVDPDLATIRGQRGYRRLLAKMERLREAERITAVDLREDDWNDVVEDLRLQVPSLLERYHVPGMTIALVHDGALVWDDAFGQSDAVERVPMDPDHGFKLGVPAHLFALLAAVQQESRGAFSVAELLRQGEEFDRHDPSRIARDFDARPRAYVFGVSRRDDSSDAAAARNAAYTDRARSVSPEGWPTYRPRMTNFVLLQTAIEQTSLETFYNFCRKNLFDPLMLDETDFVRQDATGEKPAVGHTVLGTPIESTVDASWRTPAVYTTAPDMGRLIEAMVSGDGPRPDAFPTAPALESALGPVATRLDTLGFGVHIERTPDGPCIELADNKGGMGCLLRWYPRTGSGVAVMFNSETGPDAALRVAHLALGGK